MSVVIRVRRQDLEAMVVHALADAPVECCGIIAAREGVTAGIYKVKNVEASPYRFSIDPRDYLQVERELDENGADVAGFYHSHTGTQAVPSPTDIRAMTGAGFSPPFVHFVVGVAHPESPEVRVWHIENGEKTEQEFDLVD